MSEFKKVYEYILANDKRVGATFEKLVLNILYSYLTQNNKSLKTEGKAFGSSYFDAFAPEGLVGTSNPTIIDITTLRFQGVNGNNVWMVTRKKGMENFASKVDYLIITPSDLTKEQRKNYLSKIKERFKEKEVSFDLWGFNELEPLLKQYAEFIGDPFLQPIISSLAFKNIVNKSIEKKEWKAENEKLILKVSDAYRADDLVVFVGAGVSKSAGLPDWGSLLSSLLVSLIKKNLPDSLDLNDNERGVFVNSLQKLNESSPLMEARYINTGLGEDFIGEISKSLYPEGVDFTSPLIESIANVCIPPRGALGIKALITYNFDDLIERSLDNLKIKHRSIYRDGDYPAKTEIGIFHVHGFLPQNTDHYENISESLLVFSEENYHVLMKEPYNWSNLIQLNYLRENTCLLIGLSGTDPNLRRILELAKRKTKISNHFILLQRTSNSFFEKEFSHKNFPANTNLIESINEIHHNLIEKSFSNLGVNVIWYETHGDIPGIINSIKK